MEFSASRIDYFFRCSGAWFHKYVEGREEESGEAAEVGKLVHEMIRAVLMGEQYKWKGGNFAEAVEIYNRWEKEFYPNIDPQNRLSVEEKFSIKVGDYTLVGIMDRLEDVGGFLTITDIKTSRNLLTKEQMKHNWQVRSYCVAALELYPHYKDVVFRIENPRLGEYQVLEVDKEEVARWREDLQVAMALITARLTAHERGEKEAFPYIPGTACQWCGVYKWCKAVKKAEARKASVRNVSSAKKVIGSIALLEKKLSELKKSLKGYVQEKGSVTVGGLTWGLWPSKSLKVDEAMIPDDERKLFEMYRVINDSASSALWDDGRLVVKLKSWNALKESVSVRFAGKKVANDETEG